MNLKPKILFLLALLSSASCSKSKEAAPDRWEKIAPYTWRMEVPTGWLVQMNGRTCIFVPDRGHVWELK